MKKQKPTKHQHYLSRFYLNGFTREGYLWLYDRKRQEFRRQSPIKTAVENDFYTLIDEYGEKDISVEEFFSEVENEAKHILEKVVRSRSLSRSERAILAFFIALLYVRNPSFRSEFTELGDQLIRWYSKTEFHSEEATQKIVESHPVFEAQKIDAHEIYKFVQSDAYSMEFNRNDTILDTVEIGLQLPQIFLSLEWWFLYSPTKTSFITSDRPFCILPPFRKTGEPMGNRGILVPGCSKLIALSQQCCLVMRGPGERVVFKDIDREIVKAINSWIAKESNELIIGRDEALVRRLVDNLKLQKQDRRPRFEKC